MADLDQAGGGPVELDLARLDYAEVLPDRLLVAARVGGVRLIDNVGV